MSSKKCDIAIIGSGLTGLSAALAAHSKNPHLSIMTFGIPFDSNTAKKGEIENISGIKKVVGVDLIQQVLDQINSINEKITSEEIKKIEITNEEVIKISSSEKGFLINTDQNEYSAQKVIITSGLPEKKNTIKGEEKFIHKGVSFCAVCDGALFRGKKVAIIGEGNLVARGALFLRKYCRKVTLLCPKENIGCDKKYLIRLKSAPNIKLNLGIDLETIEITGNQVVEKLHYNLNNEQKELTINAVFIEMKDKPDMSIFADLQIKLTEEGYIKTDRMKRTSNEGVFAAGTITNEIDYAPILMGDGYKAGIYATSFFEES